MMTMGARLRKLLKGSEAVVAPTVYDPVTARIASKLGFHALAHGGFATGVVTGTAEPFLSLSQHAGNVRQVCTSVDLPIIVDACQGYGDPLFVARTVRAFERAGAAAVHIEDSLYPPRFQYSYNEGLPVRPKRDWKGLIPTGEMVAKIHFALQARHDPDFVVIARTDAGHSSDGGLQEVVSRCHAYAEAGADVLMPLVWKEEDALRLSKEIPNVPLLWVTPPASTGWTERSVAEITAMGFKVVIYPTAVLTEAANGAFNVLQRLKYTGKVDIEPLEEKKILSILDDVGNVSDFVNIDSEN